MSRLNLVAVILLTLLPLISTAETLADQIRSGLTPESMVKDYRDNQQRKKKDLARRDLEWKRGQFCFEPGVSCWRDRFGDVKFLAPFPAAIEPNLPADRPWTELAWVPIDSVRDGKLTIAKLMRLAESQQALTCNELVCKVVVSTPVTSQKSQALAICKAFAVNKRFGPPSSCWTIAFNDGSSWWMQVIDAIHVVFASQRGVYKLDVEGLDRDSILSNLDRGIAAAPLLLQDRTMKNDRLMAIGPKRFSKILSGSWFEWAQVLIELDEEFRVEVSLDLLVNKQNTADPADWHLPTDQQVDEYRRAIVQTVTGALANLCLQPVWAGSTRLRCTKLRTTDGGTLSIPEGASSGTNRGSLDPRIKVRNR